MHQIYSTKIFETNELKEWQSSAMNLAMPEIITATLPQLLISLNLFSEFYFTSVIKVLIQALNPVL